MRRPLASHPWFGRLVAPVVVGAVIVVLWEAFCAWREIPVYLFPAPSDIAASFREHWRALLPALWSTLKITLTAFTLATVIGTLVAFVFVQSRAIEMSFFPYAVLLQVTPVVAIAPLIIILVKNTPVAMTVCATIIALFPIISNTTIGLRSIEPGLMNYFRMNKVGRMTSLLRLRIPSALPFFLAGLRISSGLALIGAVVAEFIAGTGGRGAGLAFEILQSGFQLDIPRMFAALFLITLTGLTMFGVMMGLQHLLLGQWHESALEAER